jgi:hypothetical protein
MTLQAHGIDLLWGLIVLLEKLIIKAFMKMSNKDNGLEAPLSIQYYRHSKVYGIGAIHFIKISRV